MSNHKKRYSLRERKADELWAGWQPEEGVPAFWKAYDQLLLRARKAQKNVVISQANASIPPPIKRKAVAKVLPSAAKRSLFRARVSIFSFTLVVGVIVYILVNAIRMSQNDTDLEAMLADIRIERRATKPLEWDSFKADESFKSDFDSALPDSLAIAYHKKQALFEDIQNIELHARHNKKMMKTANDLLRSKNTAIDSQAVTNMKTSYESLWRLNGQKLQQVRQELLRARQWYKQAYWAYLKARRKEALSMVNHQHLERAWHKVIATKQLLQNIDKHTQPAYDLRVDKEMTWLFAEGGGFTLHRVRHHKGEYFAMQGHKLKPLKAEKGIYKAQIKVYYQGQLVTYTPTKVYYELNGKQHEIAIKDFDKLEKRMEVTKY